MLKIAFFIGIYSYSVLFLGLLGLLNNFFLLPVTALFIAVLLFSNKKELKKLLHIKVKIKSKREIILFLLLGLLFFVNLVGALGPELAFDALWYHLTIPKMFLLNNKIYFIHGNLLYYNLMPKLTEMLYVVSLSLGNEIVAKIVHYSFGVLSCGALYKLSRMYLSRVWAMVVVIAFYSNLAISWLSITAYSDLPRVFFEILSIYYFLLYSKKKKSSHLVISALLLGFAISTKVLAMGTIVIFVVLIWSFKSKISIKLKRTLHYFLLSMAIPLPWFVISYLYSGNPFFPLFTHLGLRNFSLELLSPIAFIKTFVNILLFSPDPINPIYIICLPLVFILLSSKVKEYKLLFIYSALSYVIWYTTSQSGGARFLAAYLPVYTLLVILAINQIKRKIIVSATFGAILFVAIITLGYRGIANKRYIPVILGLQTKQDFLMKNLKFSFGDFYDENSEIKKIVGEKTVELMNMHNLYYVDFPFTLKEFGENKKASYVLIQGGDLPAVYKNPQFIYKNDKTHVKLYKL